MQNLQLEMVEEDNQLLSSLQTLQLKVAQQMKLSSDSLHSLNLQVKDVDSKLVSSLQDLKLETTVQTQGLSSSLQKHESSIQLHSQEMQETRDTLDAYNKFWRAVTSQVKVKTDFKLAGTVCYRTQLKAVTTWLCKLFTRCQRRSSYWQVKQV